MPKFGQIIVNTKESVRLDRYIRRYFPGITQGIIEKALRLQEIQLNDSAAKSSARVMQDDKITYELGVFETSIPCIKAKFSKTTILLAKKIISKYLIYQSEHFIAIDKPFGIAVQGGSKISLSIDDALRYLNQYKGTEYKIVHRLDKATSGILIIANGSDVANQFFNAFKNQLISKTYIAIVSGKPEQLNGNLVHYIGKDRLGIFETVKEQLITGKRAETDYTTLETLNNRSKIEFKPKTGRMHQIRFHASIIGCPIIGDQKYGGMQNKRMLLHAEQIVIDQSIFGNEIKIKSQLPVEFNLY